MKPLFILLTLAGLAASWAWAQSPAASAEAGPPRPGQWTFTVRHTGLPMGNSSRTAQACLGAAQLQAGPEQALFNAAGTGSRGPQCQLDAVQRDGSKASWTATCTTPRGAIKGPGQGQSGPEAMDLQQTIQLDGPQGAMVLRMNIDARRLGDCA
jgi:hypothetical protein